MGDNVSDFFEGFVNSKNLKKENDDLRLKIKQLLAESVLLEEIVQENEFLRESLGLGLQKEFKLSLAEVISKETGRDAILINQGSKDGLVTGLPVITEQKILLGKVAEVESNFAWVTLISDKESSFDAKIIETDISGVVRGQGTLRLKLDLVPQDKEVFKGDLVVSSSLGGVYPAGFLAGSVENIEKSDVQSFYDIELSPLFDIRSLNKVFIILNF